MITFLFVLIGVFSAVTADVNSSYFQYSVVPDVCDYPPPVVLEIKFGDKKANPGDVVTPTEAKDQPEVHYPVEKGAYYCFILTGPDAPGDTYETLPEFWHGATVNIPGDRLSEGEPLMAYMTPSPPDDKTYHRYVFLVYKQSGLLDFADEPRIPENESKGRSAQSVRRFADKYDLGDPIAGNFIRVAADKYSLEARKKMF